MGRYTDTSVDTGRIHTSSFQNEFNFNGGNYTQAAMLEYIYNQAALNPNQTFEEQIVNIKNIQQRYLVSEGNPIVSAMPYYEACNQLISEREEQLLTEA